MLAWNGKEDCFSLVDCCYLVSCDVQHAVKLKQERPQSVEWASCINWKEGNVRTACLCRTRCCYADC